MPDINSLPPSPLQPSASAHIPPRNMASSNPPNHSPPQSYSPQSSYSLAAAATLNAGLQNQDSRRSSNASVRNPLEARRRSSIRMSLNLNDPAIPSPGELQISPGSSRTLRSDPSHQRTPSLGELHQELENEQENQVNRLLGMIRQQQAQIQSLQTPPHSVAVDDSTPTSERSISFQQSQHVPGQSTAPRSRSPFVSHGLSRHSSYRSSANGSPSIRPLPGHNGPHNETGELLLGAPANARDESQFYQAETQMLTRENQMLKLRIRELERQLNPSSPSSHSPATASHLNRDPMSNMGTDNTSTADSTE